MRWILVLVVIFLVGCSGPLAGKAFFTLEDIKDFDSNSVDNPKNLFSGGYALAKYADNIICPPGFKPYSPSPNNYCVHPDSSIVISGWEYVGLPIPIEAESIKVRIENQGDCSSEKPCEDVAQTHLFTATRLEEASTKWIHRKLVEVPVGSISDEVIPIEGPETDVGLLLLARGPGGKFRSGPRWHYSEVVAVAEVSSECVPSSTCLDSTTLESTDCVDGSPVTTQIDCSAADGGFGLDGSCVEGNCVAPDCSNGVCLPFCQDSDGLDLTQASLASGYLWWKLQSAVWRHEYRETCAHDGSNRVYEYYCDHMDGFLHGEYMDCPGGTSCADGVCGGGTPPGELSASFTITPNPTVAGSYVTLDGDGSSSPFGDIVLYEWDLLNNGEFTSSPHGDGRITHMNYYERGTKTINMRITDSADNTAVASNDLVVECGKYYDACEVLTARFTITPSPATVGGTITVSASATVTPFGRVKNHEWDFDDDGIYEVANGFVLSHQTSYDTPGTKTINLRVTDLSDNVDTTSKEVVVS